MSNDARERLRRMAHESLVLANPPYLRHYPGARFERREGVTLVASPLEGPGFNYATALDSGIGLESVAASAQDFFGSKPGGWGILVEGGAGSPLEAELRAAGWEVAEDEPAFILPEIPAARPAHEDLEIHVADNLPALADFRRVTVEAFGAPLEMAEQFTPDSMATDRELAFVVGYLRGEPVSAAMMSMGAGGACIAGVATIESQRGRGFGAALTWAAIDAGLERGATYAALRSGPKSMPLYRRLGFQYACQHATYAATPGAIPG